MEYSIAFLGVYNDAMYPANYGLVRISKIAANLTFFEYLQYSAEIRSGSNADSTNSNNICMIWTTTYNNIYPNRVMTWNKALSSETEATQVIRSSLQIKRPSDYSQINIITSNNRERRLDCGADLQS